MGTWLYNPKRKLSEREIQMAKRIINNARKQCKWLSRLVRNAPTSNETELGVIK